MTQLKIIQQIIKNEKISKVFWNRDYSPYAKERDYKIERMCAQMNVSCLISSDYYLNEPGTILTKSGTYYLKYTPYMKRAIKRIRYMMREWSSDLIKEKNKAIKIKSFLLDETKYEQLVTLSQIKKHIPASDYQTSISNEPEETQDKYYIRSKLMNALESSQTENKYSENRDVLNLETTRLSAAIKFGIVSIREVYWAYRNNITFIKQLIWRDFYAQIMDSNPRVIDGKFMDTDDDNLRELKTQYSNLIWPNKITNIRGRNLFQRWCEGNTGYPVVDAGMREMNSTGYMHNRARLITASFLIKTLLIDWKEGERYYATRLRDYDPASNNGNWQWVAGTGADSQPYFRIFNPWLQSKKHDPDAIYIKKWIPELKEVEVKHIHEWYKYHDLYEGDYPAPLVDYKTQKVKALKMYKDIFK